MSTLGPEQIVQWKKQLVALGPPGLAIRTSYHLTEPYEDWSKVRSPSRARRRMKHGHRQRVNYMQRPARKAFQINGEIWMHPEMEKHMRAAIARHAEKCARLVIERGQLGAMLGMLGFGPPEAAPE